MKPSTRTIGPNRRSLTGRVARDAGQSTDFESSLERDFFTLLRFDPSVLHFQEQPVSIDYRDHLGRPRTYTPDVLVHLADTTGQRIVLYEVKYRADLRDRLVDYKSRFRAAMRYARNRGWIFHIVTETEIRGSSMLPNARFLLGYRDAPADPAIEDHLLGTVRSLGECTPEEIIVAAYNSWQMRMRALAHVWRLVARRRLVVDLESPLTMTSKVCIGEDDRW